MRMVNNCLHSGASRRTQMGGRRNRIIGRFQFDEECAGISSTFIKGSAYLIRWPVKASDIQFLAIEFSSALSDHTERGA